MAYEMASPYLNETVFNGYNLSVHVNGSDVNGTDPYEYYYYYYYETVYTKPQPLDTMSLEIPFKGYVYPILALCTILANIVVMAIFSRREMRNPTSILLICLAVSDSLVCVALLPKFIYLYPTKNYLHYIPYGPCKAFQTMSNLYRMARTASNFITVILGVQRYIIVCKPFRAKQICTSKNSLLAVCCVSILSVLLHLWLFLVIEVQPVPVFKDNSLQQLPDGCTQTIAKWFAEAVSDVKQASWIYYVISGVISRLLPCTILLVMTVLLVLALRNRRRTIGRSSSCHNENSERNTNRITKFVVAVLVIFIVTEIQDAVAFCIYIYEMTAGHTRSVLSKRVDVLWDLFGVLGSLIGYHLNFWIYLVMSRQFRKVLCGIVCPEDAPKREGDKQTTTSLINDSSSVSTKLNRASEFKN